MTVIEMSHKNFTILSSKCNVPGVVSEIIDYLKDGTKITGCSCINDIRVVLSELISNAVIHGNSADVKKPVDIIAEIIGDRIVCRITDRGPAFVPGNLEKEDLLCESGRGIKICHILCTKMEYSYEEGIGNSVTVAFYIKDIEGGNLL